MSPPLVKPLSKEVKGHYLITPELPLQQLVEVLSVVEGTSMGCSWICDAVGSSQCRVHIDEHLLPVFHHPVHHLVTKVSGWVVWQVPVTIFGTRTPTVVNLETVLDGRKQTIAIAFNLKNKQNLNEMVLKEVWIGNRLTK